MPAHETLLLIDPATSGCAGAYIDVIRRNLGENEAVEVAVSHYFPFQYGRRIFYRYSELTAQTRYRLGRTRLYVRFAELLVALTRLAAHVVAARPRVVCYALSSNLWLEYLFLWFVQRMTSAKVFLICHDVVPFVSPGESYDAKVRKRRKFYTLADRLVVHNANSVEDLVNVFGVSPDKIVSFPFPLYDLDRMGLREIPVLGPATRRRFLFIGHLRVEKGIEVLLEAWARFRQSNTNAELVIAGTLPAGCEYDFRSVGEMDVTLLTRYLTDEEYVNLIREADCVVLPYRRGTNSAVVSTVLALRRNLIVSDIEMFRNNPLIPARSFFRSGDAGSLADRLVDFGSLDRDQQLLLDRETEQAFQRHATNFRQQVTEVFAEALSH